MSGRDEYYLVCKDGESVIDKIEAAQNPETTAEELRAMAASISPEMPLVQSIRKMNVYTLNGAANPVEIALDEALKAPCKTTGEYRDRFEKSLKGMDDKLFGFDFRYNKIEVPGLAAETVAEMSEKQQFTTRLFNVLAGPHSVFVNGYDALQEAIVNHPNVPKDVLTSIGLEMSRDSITDTILQRKDCPVEVFRAHMSDYNARLLMAENSSLPEDMMKELAEYNNPSIDRRLCENENVTPEVLDVIARSNDFEIRQLVADHPKTEEKTLLRLSEDEKSSVKRRADARLGKTSDREQTGSRMTKEQFAQAFAKELGNALREATGSPVHTEFRTVQKNNGLKNGLVLHFENSDIAPTIYPDDIYNNFVRSGIPLNRVVDDFCRQVMDSLEQDHIGMPELTPEEAKKHITLTLINAEKNKEMLKNTPHFLVGDGELAAIPRWLITNEASFVVDNQICERIGISPDDALTFGKESIEKQEFESVPMKEMMAQLMGVEPEEIREQMGFDMMVMTTKDHIQGAKVLLSKETLDRVHEAFGDFVVLPSSVHEVLALPLQKGMSPRELQEMVREVNHTHVLPEEVLSDRVLKYDGHTLSLFMDTPKEISHEHETYEAKETPPMPFDEAYAAMKRAAASIPPGKEERIQAALVNLKASLAENDPYGLLGIIEKGDNAITTAQEVISAHAAAQERAYEPEPKEPERDGQRIEPERKNKGMDI